MAKPNEAQSEAETGSGRATMHWLAGCNDDGWNDVTRLLPTNREEVIVANCDTKAVTLSYYKGTGIWNVVECGLTLFPSVTHWMKKPEPPLA